MTSQVIEMANALVSRDDGYDRAADIAVIEARIFTNSRVFGIEHAELGVFV